jgi:hypothetical protein
MATSAIGCLGSTVSRISSLTSPLSKGKESEAYLEVKRKLGDDWTTDLSDGLRYCEIAIELGYTSQFERFKQYQRSDVSTVEQFLSRYYKPERYTGRGEEYAAGLLATYQREVEQSDFCFISHHDSVTGSIVSFYPTTGEKQS